MKYMTCYYQARRKSQTLHGFADDHAMKCTFKASDRQADAQALSNIGLNASNFQIHRWMMEKLNSSCPDSKVQLAKWITNSININGNHSTEKWCHKIPGGLVVPQFNTNWTCKEKMSPGCDEFAEDKTSWRVLTQEVTHMLVMRTILVPSWTTVIVCLLVYQHAWINHSAMGSEQISKTCYRLV